MSLTKDKKEKDIILKTIEEISSIRKENQMGMDTNGNYFLEDEKLDTFRFGGIVEYSPINPADIEDILNDLWEIRKTPEMRCLARVCTIAAMKNKGVSIINDKKSISAAVYEF